MTPTGRATPNCGCGACASCARQCNNTSKNCGRSPSPRSARRGCSPPPPSWKARSTTCRSRRTPRSPMRGHRISVRPPRWESPPRRTIAREAVGVVGAITPWNFPHQINLAKLGPRAGRGQHHRPQAGCPTHPGARRCSGKSSPNTPTFRPASSTSSLPVTTVWAPFLAKDPRVDMVSFTGSTATGRSVMADAAVTIKKVFLELGGKSAFVVLDDADLGAASSVSAFTASMHAGQGCAITTRLVVPRARYDEAVAIAAGTMSSIKARRPQRTRNRLRATDFGATARSGTGLPRPGDRRGRDLRVRRRPAEGQGRRFLHRAHRDRGPGQTTPGPPGRRSSGRCSP